MTTLNTVESYFFASVSKASFWNTVVGNKEDQKISVHLHFFLYSSRVNVAKNKEGLVGVPREAETKLRVCI